MQSFGYSADAGAPPDGFLIDGHVVESRLRVSCTVGAPPDGFLIDGHPTGISNRNVIWLAHRLTGFSSMDTRKKQPGRAARRAGAPPDGFLIDGHVVCWQSEAR